MNSANAHIITKLLFESELKRKEDMFTDIHSKQKSLTGSLNFIYKNEVYSISKKGKVNVLDKSLTPSMKEALKYQDELVSDINFVTRYLSLHASDKKRELYNVLPPCSHEILRKHHVREPSEIKPVKYSNYETLADILQKRHLEKLL